MCSAIRSPLILAGVSESFLSVIRDQTRNTTTRQTKPMNTTGMRRLLISNDTHVVNFADTGSGLMMAKAFRRNHPQFKHRRIRPILQLKPLDVPMGDILERTFSH